MKIFPVGIGNLIDREELKYMVDKDDPDADNKILVIDSFNAIKEKPEEHIDRMIKRICP